MAELAMYHIDEQKLMMAINVGSKIVPPVIKLVRGHLFKKNIETRLIANAVFTLYNTISIEEFNDLFVKKVSLSKKSKTELEIDGLRVGYSIHPNIQTFFPTYLDDNAYDGEMLSEQEDIPLFTVIDQIRFFIFPSQEQMSVNDLKLFIKNFDVFLSQIEKNLRKEEKIPLNLIVKNIIFESDNKQLLQNCPKVGENETLNIHCSNKRVFITYSNLEEILKCVKTLVN
ncbi:MAG: hypothetical protein LBC12_00355 [Nitrososphaerota archaeon]|jgi:hypothetical protein|nr:hypothetical protein [Nitrososphaerota archaeon]